MLLKVQIDGRTLDELNQAAARELRPLSLQAVVEIRRALGTYRGGEAPASVIRFRHPAAPADK